MAKEEIREAVLAKIETILAKPRVSAYTPQALVEMVCTLLSLSYNENKFQKYMFREFGSHSKPWWLSEDLDYTLAVSRLKNLIEYLKEGNFEL